MSSPENRFNEGFWCNNLIVGVWVADRELEMEPGTGGDDGRDMVLGV